VNLNMLQFLQNNSAEFSWMRGVGALWLVGILAMWCYCSFVAGCLQVIPESVIFIAGMVLTGKVVEKRIEEKPKDNCDESTKNIP
jgi:biotin transporter BioY